MVRKGSFGLLFIFVTVSICQGQSNASVSLLALGDSYTIGEGIPIQQSWPFQLADSLHKYDISLANPDILAVTGWTTSDLLNGIEQATFNQPYDLVSLLIGVNNQYRGYEFGTYPMEFRKLLKQAINFAGGNPERVIVISIPDYGVTQFGQKKNPDKIADELERYNEAARQITKKYNVSFINITPISQKALTEPALVAKDNLHPSGLMYGQWISKKILPVVIPKLKDRR